MIGDTLTLENLTAIYEAMKRIKQIDRSDFFENYYQEIIERINDYERRAVYQKV